MKHRTALALVRKPDDAPTHTTIERADDGAVTITRIVYQAAPDELLPFPFGLEEEAAAKSLVRTGKLPAVKIGRRIYARRSDVLALVDKLVSTRARAANDTPAESYQDLVARSRGAR